MKTIDIFCASQASTSICLSMDQPSSSSAASSSTAQLGGRAIDRCNPIIRDVKRHARTLSNPPCSYPKSPINPQPYYQLHQKTKKTSNSKQKDPKNKKILAKQNDHDHQKKTTTFSHHDNHAVKKNSSMPSEIIKSCVNPNNLVTPPGSSRYLLGDTLFFYGLPEKRQILDLVPVEDQTSTVTTVNHQDHESSSSMESSDSLSQPKPTSSNQVVVLRVSLHCKGCEGKVRKHLSRMEGVTSFNIDFKQKKVTIEGDITPSSVLESVSKVKNARFWTSLLPPPPAPPMSSASSSIGLTNNNIEMVGL